ncbi:MAG: hypothetical protein Q9207_004163 [Kuettlingeria erythrocarpa]
MEQLLSPRFSDIRKRRNGPAPGYDPISSSALDVLAAGLKRADHECNVVVVALEYISEIIRFEE